MEVFYVEDVGGVEVFGVVELDDVGWFVVFVGEEFGGEGLFLIRRGGFFRERFFWVCVGRIFYLYDGIGVKGFEVFGIGVVGFGNFVWFDVFYLYVEVIVVCGEGVVVIDVFGEE